MLVLINVFHLHIYTEMRVTSIKSNKGANPVEHFLGYKGLSEGLSQGKAAFLD